jgi:hypothetical protein
MGKPARALDVRGSALWGEIAFYIVVAVFAYFLMEFRFALNQEFPFARLQDLVDFRASTPFQYRILVPALARGLLAMGLPFIETVDSAFRFIEWSSLLLVAVVFRAYLRCFAGRAHVATLAAFSIFYVLPFSFIIPRRIALWFPWDIPSVLLFTLGLLLLYRRKWFWYYAVFAVATLNRETTCFLIIVYAFTAWGNERGKTIALHVTAQAVLWLGIKAILYWAFSGSSGAGLFETHHIGRDVTHLSTNIEFLLEPRNYPLLFSAVGFVWIPAVLFYRQLRDPFLRRAMWVAAPFFAGMMYVSNIYEMRIYGELIPVFLAPALVILTGASADSAPKAQATKAQ